MDYRVRTGEERRERMRSILIQSALITYCKYGINGVAIEELIRVAGVSRGTFYNHFKTNEELFEAVSVAVCTELISVVNSRLIKYEDPAERVACGVRLCLEIGAKYQQIAIFISRGGAATLRHNHLLTEYLPRDLENGIASGRFVDVTPQLAFDLVVGPVLAGFHTLSTSEKAKDDYIKNLSMSVLQSLGVKNEEARKISQMPIEPFVLQDDSLIVQTHKHAKLL